MPVADDAQIIRAALTAIISRVALVSPYYEMARDAEVALGRIVREREMGYEALKAWEHWYSVESTEFTRDTARDLGLKVIAKVEARKEGMTPAGQPPEVLKV